MNKKIIMTTKLFPYCDEGCPVMDPGFIDNGPLSINFAMISNLPAPITPTLVVNIGAASTFSTFNFFLGRERLDVWSSTGGVNVCPFPDVSVCSALTMFREVVKRVVDPETLAQYLEVSTAYAVWLPQSQIMADLCGDPLAYENFKGACSVQSFCSMAITVIPSDCMKIQFTLRPLNVILAIAYLGNT